MRRQIISRIPAFAALLLLCIVIALYLDGWFDISFIVRGDDSPDETVGTDIGTDADTDPDTGIGDASTAPPETETDAPVTTETPSRNDPVTDSAEHVVIPDADSLGNGYSLSYSDWIPNDSWKLAEVKLDNITYPGYFSSYQSLVRSVSYAPSGVGKPYDVIYTSNRVDAPAVTLYMGYIIVESEKKNTVNIYSSDGDAIGSYDRTKMSLAWCRDRDGRPLFLYSGAYYYLDAEKNEFVLSDYDPNTENRGALFDYTPDYGVSAEKTRKFIFKSELVDELIPVDGTTDTFYVVPTLKYSFALADAAGKALGEYSYTGAYAFSGSRAAVLDADGHLSYITTSGSTAIKPSKQYRDVNLNRTVIEYFMEPLSNGTESIGFYFFEHGLTRARILTIDNYYLSKDRFYVISDENVVITTSGERFNTPVGYEVESYSSGVLLLRGKDGCGYMDYTGTWIVDPDLDDAQPFYEGLAVAKKNGKYALYDTAGNIVIPYGQFSYISNASSGVIAAYDGEWHIFYKMKGQ